jgi:hypothetical protein
VDTSAYTKAAGEELSAEVSRRLKQVHANFTDVADRSRGYRHPDRVICCYDDVEAGSLSAERRACTVWSTRGIPGG